MIHIGLVATGDNDILAIDCIDSCVFLLWDGYFILLNDGNIAQSREVIIIIKEPNSLWNLVKCYPIFILRSNR